MMPKEPIERTISPIKLKQWVNKRIYLRRKVIYIIHLLIKEIVIETREAGKKKAGAIIAINQKKNMFKERIK
jgi:hypothetical protein